MSSNDKDGWKSRLLGLLAERVQRAIISGVRRGLMKLIRIMVFAIAGVIVLAAGILFLWIGFYYYLSAYLPHWVSWLIVGFTSMILGLILLLAAYLTR
ncbi:MAG: hypothetical protein ACP5QI_08210 [Candidatus Bathyarchaeia archaeon]